MRGRPEFGNPGAFFGEDRVSDAKWLMFTVPYAGSVWLLRKRKGRPKVVPKGSTNFGFIGQFCELPLDAVYTMEYSVRSAREAVSTLLKLDAKPPPVYQGQYDVDALHGALKALA